MLTWIFGILFVVTSLALVLVLTTYEDTKKRLKELAPLGFSVATQNLALRAELKAGNEALTKLQEENKQLREQLEQMDAWAGKVADTIEGVLADNEDKQKAAEDVLPTQVDEDAVHKQFVATLKTNMANNDITPTELSRRINAEPSYVHAILRGRIKPSKERLQPLMYEAKFKAEEIEHFNNKYLPTLQKQRRRRKE